MRIKKAVITAAGFGTRVLPFSKSVPKEMLPIIIKDGKKYIVKPYIQFIFENLYDNGIREFCFVLGKNKSEIVEHFTLDYPFVEYLEKKGKSNMARPLKRFYDKVRKSKISWILNPISKGFGHSVLVSESFVENDNFVLCASDVWVTSETFLKEAIDIFFKEKSDATLILRKMDNWWNYGIAKIDGTNVTFVKEKPKKFISDLCIVPIYIFSCKIFDALRKVEIELKDGEEFELTNAIEKLVETGNVSCLVLKNNERWLDTGLPEKYKEVLDIAWEEYPWR